MRHSYEDLERLVYPLVRISDSMRRAQTKQIDPTRLGILRAAAVRGRVRPSELAADLDVHQSSITRQTRALEDAGHVRVEGDPDDRRSCLISLTDEGWEEVKNLTRLGLDRFSVFLESWEPADVRTLADLLSKLEQTILETKQRTQRPGGRRWQRAED